MTDSSSGSVTVSASNDCTTLLVKGSFAFHLQSEFRSAYEQSLGTSKKIVVDLSDTEYMDSSGLGMLLVMKKYLDGKGIAYEISRSHGQTYDLLSMTHFNQYFSINGEKVVRSSAR
jgi:anti-anti-sigma factor